MEDNPLQTLGIFLIFIILNAIMYSYGEALKNINENELERRIEKGNKKAEKILQMIEKPDKFIITIQVMSTTIALYVGFLYVDVLLAFVFGLLLLLIGILVPKKIGAKYNETVAFVLYPIARFFMIILTPVTVVLTIFGNILLRLVGIDPNETYENVTEEEIISMVNEGHEQGVLEEQEVEMISNIIELDEKQASDIMIHRNKIIYISSEATIKEALDFMIGANYSRFPVVEEENIDSIIGIVHIKEVITEYHKGIEDEKIKNLEGMRKPVFIPETRNIDDIFKEMQSEKNHMEIVVDEYGQTVGLLTMEDILEEIVGNIMDEYDVEETNIIQESDRTYLIKGMTTLKELEDKLSLHFEQEDYDTLNGLLISELDRIPEANEKPSVTVENVRFDVLSVEKNRIAQVRMTLPEMQEENEE